MSRSSRRKAENKTSVWQRILSWRPRLRLGPVRREIVGWILLIVAALTALGLSGVSSGELLAWWATSLRALFGWGAYPVALGLALLGLRLIWRDLDARIYFGPSTLVGLELVLLVLLVASHAPLVVRSGSDQALLAAEQGRAGGFVGWSLAVLLMEELGVLVGSGVMLAVLTLGLGLLLPLSWSELAAWLHRQSRRVVAGLSRWWVARQGTPVPPGEDEAQELRWWEVDPPAAEMRPKQRSRPRRTARARPRPATDSELPPLDLLDADSPRAYGDTDVRRKTTLIEETLASFGVPAQVVEVSQGPTVTQFGLDPGYIERRSSGGEVLRQRVRVARISSLVDDLALALAAAPIRIEAPVPGRSVVGLEVPNDEIALVSLRGVLEAPEFHALQSGLAIALGVDVAGQPVAVDLARMPHLLIAGATGSGKSVCINAIVCSLLCNNSPDDLQMLMVDPKMVELVGYNGIPHLLAPVVVQTEQVVGALAWVTRQMDERYKLLHQAGVRNLEQYNQRMRRRKDEQVLPTLVIFIDELADLMMVAPDEVERHICRVAQMGRATGIHLVIATQRPSVDVVTGLIKANFPARISFAVTSQIDSRVILDQGGAESLLGRGDMLFLSPQQAAPVRLQGCFVSDAEIDRLTAFWRGKAAGTAPAPGQQTTGLAAFPWTGHDLDAERGGDDLLSKAIRAVDGRDRVSTSFLQRKLRIGFPRAARLMEQLEDQGVVGPDEGAGRGREVFGSGIDLRRLEERLPGVEPD